MPIEHRPPRPLPRKAASPQSHSHRVRDGESWATLAERYGIAARDIIGFNFGTTDLKQVNWYLNHHTECNRATRDGMNWMFSSSAKYGFIQIPPKDYTFDNEVIELKPPPRYYWVNVKPWLWDPPAELSLPYSASAKSVVSFAPWQHGTFSLGPVSVIGRSAWKAREPEWKNEVIYYNVFSYPLEKTLYRIVLHHTNNDDPIQKVEDKQIDKPKKFAAIGYHFFIDKSGRVFEGRPLEVMGSDAGEGLKPGPKFDPDFYTVGIVLQGKYDAVTRSDPPPPAQLQSLERLVLELRARFPLIRKLLLHREIKDRKGEPTVCPGLLVELSVVPMRKRLGMTP